MKLIGVVGMAALMCSTMALADNPNANQRGSMVRPFAQVTANRAKNPQAPGLTNAQARIFLNAGKHADNGPSAAGAEWEEHLEQVEHVKKVERFERPERPERALSPSVTDRPTTAAFGDRPLPPGLVDRGRPLPPGHARRR